MSYKIDRKTYAQTYGPTAGDRVRLADTELFIEVEKELTKEPLTISKGNNIKNLNGTLLRNGPGILERGGQWVHHPFDGDGMITSIKFENGQPFLTNRFVKTKGYLEEEKIDKFIKKYFK